MRQTLFTLGSVLVIAALLTYWMLPPPPERFQPSPYAALVPEPGDNFADYVAESRTRIRNALRRYYYNGESEPFRNLYTLDEVARMRAPFELTPASNCTDTRLGILMIHGLTDSPYLLRPAANALAYRFPCATIRGLLTPGHSTVPGDLLTVGVDEWRAITDYGVDSFDGEVDELVVLGYSNGSALTLDYLNRHPQQTRIDRIVLVSPGLQSTNNNAYLAPWLRFVWPWLNEYADEDAVKYESFPTRAAAEFYQLTADVIAGTQSAIGVPALMVASGYDTTVRSDIAANYFCQWMDDPDSRLYWYTDAEDQPPAPPCDRIELRPVPSDIPRFISYSHVAFMIPQGDRHYGLDGNYPACLAYADDSERYERCMTDDANTVYAEGSFMNSEGLYEGKLVRRSTFNPDFDGMIESIACFIDRSCHG